MKILIADDHQLVREGIGSMIAGEQDIEVIGLVPSGEEAINRVREDKPDVVLMDIVMPGMNGIEAARWIKEIDNEVRVIMLSMEISKDYVTAAIKSDVDGYLLKDISKETLLEALRAVHKGERFFLDAVKKLIFEDFYDEKKLKRPNRKLRNRLTGRETQVLELVASGRSNMEIADALSVSTKTVETHKTHVLMKLGLNNKKELMRYAKQYNIVKIQST